MATRRYGIAPQDAAFQVTATAGLAVIAKPTEVTVDWDGLIASGLSGQQARLQVLGGLKKIIEYIEQTDKFQVNA